MALDLSAVVRAVGGSCLVGTLPERTLVDGTADLDAYVVVGNPSFATLVTGDRDALIDALLTDTSDARRAARRAALIGAVYVSAADDHELRAALAAAHMTAILGTHLTDTALSATLTSLIADDRAAADRLVTAGMNVLTQVARRGGVTAVIAELARRIDGWAVLLDTNGHMIASAGAGRLHVSDATAVALGRPVKVRHHGLQLHRVGSEADHSGSLVIATRSGRTSHARDLSSLAAALFDLLLRTHNPSLTDQLGRAALLSTLHEGGQQADELLHRWGVHEQTLTAIELGARTRTIDVDQLARRWFDELGAEHVFAGVNDRIVGMVRNDIARQLADRVEEFAPIGGARVHLGIGSPAPATALSRSAVQAHQALEAAFETGNVVAHYERLPTVALILSTLTNTAESRLASLLDPLRDDTGAHGELTTTLRTFLAENGAHRASAEQLGVHRHTVVSRIRKVEDLTGLSLDRADDRATAWLALRSTGH